jgi:transglutaminase-like putative cysteine protease
MRFDLRYRTQFTYTELTRESQNELRACPMADINQQLISYRVATTPSTRVLSFTDYFGTRVDAFGLREPHISFEVVAEASVETWARPLVTSSPRASALAEPGFLDEHLEYLAPTSHTDWDDELAAKARSIAALPGDDVVGIVLALQRHVHSALEYVPGSTEIGVDVNSVLQAGRGVCQDYAHVAVAMCRAAGVPARYVSGYFFAADESTGAVDGDVVEVQTHAWIEAAIPAFGWLALDPTNGLQVGERHVKIGHGRDYDDVQPIRGTFVGTARPVVEAGVEIRRLAGAQLHMQVQQQQQ